LFKFEEYQVRINSNKCKLLRTSVDYLGFRVDQNGFSASPSKMQALRTNKKPASQTRVEIIHWYGHILS
jgi:hypothetical protein